MSAISILILLAIVAIITAAIIRATRMPRAIRHGAVCGECGYGFSGWTTCPECGKAAAHSGVLSPALWTKFRADPSGVVLGWIFLGLVASNAVTTSLQSAATRAGYQAMGAEQTGWGTDADGKGFALVLAAEGLTRHDLLQAGTVRVTLKRSRDATSNPRSPFGERVAWARMDVGSGATRVMDRDGTVVGKFNGLTTEAVSLLYRTGGLAGEGEAISPAAGSISDVVQDGRIDWNAAFVPFKAGRNGSHHAGPTLPFAIFGEYGRFYEGIIALLGLTAAGLGVCWSLRRRARAFALAATPMSDSA